MTPLGIGIVGTGNIAGGYARDIATHPEIRLVAATDLQPDRAAAFAETHGCRAHASLDDLLVDPDVDIVVNLTVHHAHYDVTSRALEAGRHVYSEKPLALTPDEARELVDLAAERGLRLGCSPSTFLGEAQQTAAATIRRGRPRHGPGHLCRRQLGPHRVMASGARRPSSTSASWSMSASIR